MPDVWEILLAIRNEIEHRNGVIILGQNASFNEVVEALLQGIKWKSVNNHVLVTASLTLASNRGRSSSIAGFRKGLAFLAGMEALVKK